jgi:hypothetical protein
MNDIYDQHHAAFSNVLAYVITDKKGARVATVAFKFSRAGTGRVWCYLHIIGLPMVRGMAGGYGYDKQSAASLNAARKVATYSEEDLKIRGKNAANRDAIVEALNGYEGLEWARRVENAGFNVLQAV